MHTTKCIEYFISFEFSKLTFYLHRIGVSYAVDSYTILLWFALPQGICLLLVHIHTVQRLMLSNGAKWTIFYHITVILQYCGDKTIARSGDMYRDDSGIFSLVIKRFGITNTSVQNFANRISSVKTVPKCFRKLKVFWKNLIWMYHLCWCFHSVRWSFVKTFAEIV